MKPTSLSSYFFKFFSVLFLGVFAFLGSVKADFSGFLNQLKMMNIPVETFITAKGISRYDLARLLNAVECKDCLTPPQDMINKYTDVFRNQFVKIPGKDFADISYLGGWYNQYSYYYCVAYVGDNAYMRGYPLATSPICAGKFCGERNVTKAEFIQVGINLIAKYLFKNLSLNRKEVKKRLENQKPTSYAAKTFTPHDSIIISELAQTCGTTPCPLRNPDEVKTYLKYCMFNLSACGMGEIGKLKAGVWPVAEINFLYKQNIIDLQEAAREDINDIMDGKRILEILYNLYKITDCSFNHDYDCDGLDNVNDSCPNAYNPSQKDYDHDGIGDVCDDDIDNDNIKNPLGIVDDNGNINIATLRGRTGILDNCIFVPNTDQQDNNHNNKGDICEEKNTLLSLYINVLDFKGNAPLTAKFEAVSQGEHEEVQWEFGDGKHATGNIVSHTFEQPGHYLVKAFAKGKNTNDATAQISVIVGGTYKDQKALQIKASALGGTAPLEITFSPSSIGEAERIEWNRGNGLKTYTSYDQAFKKVFGENGSFPVVVKAYQGGMLIGVSAFVVGVGNTPGSMLKANILNPNLGQKVEFQTLTYGFTPADIVDVQRNFGDGTIKNNAQLMISHAFKERGTRVVMQTITLKNGQKLTNLITLYVVDTALLLSYTMQTFPEKLNPNPLEKISFTSLLKGDTLNSFLNFLQTYDNETSFETNKAKFPIKNFYAFSKGGIFYPQTTLYINECVYLHNQSTLAVYNFDRCLEIGINKNFQNFKCDLDKDGIPDICDDDIDGDGIKNLIGIINYENENCLVGSNLSDKNNNIQNNALTKENVNLYLLKKHYQGVCTLDNAPFYPNPDQLDVNADGYGDKGNDGISSLLHENLNEKDSDGDGIPDSKDLCPDIKENYNTFEDYDGCPEIGKDLACEGKNLHDLLSTTPLISLGECNQCPCPLVDINANLSKGDIIKAILRDKKKEVLYRYSPSFGFEF